MALLTHWEWRDILFASRIMNDHAAGQIKAPSFDVKRIAIYPIDLPDLIPHIRIAHPTPDGIQGREPGLCVYRGIKADLSQQPKRY